MSQSKKGAREQARALMAAQKAAEARRKRLLSAGVFVGIVVIAIGILVGVKLSSGGAKSGGPAATKASSEVISKITGVPAATLDTIGIGKIDTAPKGITGQPVLTADGKPLVVYIGAEYCPFCAAERWAMIVALSRFGTFSNLGQTHSSSVDSFPNTPTLSFHGATYTSKYLSFQGVETQSNQISGNSYTALDTLTADQQKLLATYDAAPYVPANAAGSIPFIDFANQAIVSGASYSPQLLAGMTVDQVAAVLSDPSNPIAQAVGGAANAFTAVLCKLTNDQPANVCVSPAASAYQGKIGG